jgi:uncharacterized protein (TIGR02594 family)
MKTSTVLMKQLVLEYFISTGQHLNFHCLLNYFQSKVQLFSKTISFDFKKTKYIVTLFSVLLCGNVISQKMSFSEKRILVNYKKGNFYKAYNLSKKQVEKRNYSPVISYCYALSNYQLNKHNLKSYCLDKSLKFLVIAIEKADNRIVELLNSDSAALKEIESKAEQFSKNELSTRNKRSVKRMDRMLVIFNDTSEVYIAYLENVALKKQKLIEDRFANSRTNSIDIDLNQSNEVASFQTKKDFLIALADGKVLKSELIQLLEQKLNVTIYPSQRKVLHTAVEEYGVENFEKSNNPEVLKYFKETGFGYIKTDETSWCAAFVNYCVKQNGYKYPHSLTARSWLGQGKKVTDPKTGDIIIFWREKKNGWKGHVAFFVEADKENGLVYCYGGNQDGKVCVKAYPEDRVLAYRRVVN